MLTVLIFVTLDSTAIPTALDGFGPLLSDSLLPQLPPEALLSTHELLPQVSFVLDHILVFCSFYFV